MKTYSEREVFSPDELRLFERATALVRAMPHLDPLGREVRCHEVARVVASHLKLPHYDGLYELGAQHSWCETPGGHVLDVYAVGRIPPVQLIAVVTTMPRRFRRGSYREDIREGIITWLIDITTGGSRTHHCEAHHCETHTP